MPNLWETCLQSLSEKIPPHVFKTWIEQLDFSINDDLTNVIINAHTRVKLDFIKSNYSNLILEIITKNCPSVKNVEFIIMRRDASANKTPSEPPKLTKTNLPSLPILAENVVGVPNVIARSALFGVSKTRNMVKAPGVEIASVGGFLIEFCAGEMFNQGDLDLLLCLYHLSKPNTMDDMIVRVSANTLLKMLGRGTSGKHHKELDRDLIRLQSGVVSIKDTKTGDYIRGQFVLPIEYEKNNFTVLLSAKMAQVYKYSTGYSLVEWEQRLALGNNLLAKWLLNQYVSHAKPLPYKVETIRQLSRSGTGALYEFRRMLREALAMLQEVGAITSWEIDSDDLVHVTRNASASQVKHLRKARAKAVK